MGTMDSQIIQDVKNSPEYWRIERFYHEKYAKRSGVAYMNHINEGLVVLDMIGARDYTMKAFCLHPCFQDDQPLVQHFQMMKRGGVIHDALPFILAMEYRRTANAYLSKHTMPEGGIKLSPLPEVNQMLIADKVQNCKDFMKYHLNTHPKSERLFKYFKEWLEALGVTTQAYKSFVAEMEKVESK